MFPDGFHPLWQYRSRNFLDPAVPARGRISAGAKYYFTDFGISSYFPDPSMSRLVTGAHGLDESVPELNTPLPYEAFPVDIYILGNVYKRHFVDVRLSRLSPCHFV